MKARRKSKEKFETDAGRLPGHFVLLAAAVGARLGLLGGEPAFKDEYSGDLIDFAFSAE